MDLDYYVQLIIEYVRLHQVWAAPIVFVLCFAESLAFISLIIPAWGVLVGLGALISASGLNFWPILAAGAIGRRWATGYPTGSGSSLRTASITCGRCRSTRT